MKNFAFIFARGGSKGLPGKNIKPLAGKPLIQYSIETAKNAHPLMKYLSLLIIPLLLILLVKQALLLLNDQLCLLVIRAQNGFHGDMVLNGQKGITEDLNTLLVYLLQAHFVMCLMLKGRLLK